MNTPEDFNSVLTAVTPVVTTEILVCLPVSKVTDVTELIAGRNYWLIDKVDPKVREVAECRTEDDYRYFGSRMWAMPDNNQAMQRWDIYGPLPVINYQFNPAE